MRRFIIIIASVLMAVAGCRAAEEEVSISTPWGAIAATLATPDGNSSTAVLIIAGSGPTDRNCNSSLNLNTYAFKMLSDELTREGFAVLRYDKRAIGLSHYPAEEVPNIVFQDFIDDAALCVGYLRDAGYEKVIVAGHSEGGRIAIDLALRDDIEVDGIVLLSAAGYSMETILMRQLSAQLMPAHMGLMVSATNIIQSLKRGDDVPEDRIPKELLSLFHPTVQPFIRSYLTTDPAELMAEVDVPALIISGGRDIQVTIDNAERLKSVAKHGKHINFEDMSHVLKDATSNDQIEQLVSVYTNSQLPLTKGLSSAITEFIDNI